jgi:hypothetical protein
LPILALSPKGWVSNTPGSLRVTEMVSLSVAAIVRCIETEGMFNHSEGYVAPQAGVVVTEDF